MFQLFFSMAALAQEPLPANAAAQDAAEEAAVEEDADERAPIVIETISVTGRVPTPEVQIMISRPRIPVMSTEEMMETIDERLAEEEARR